jgi:TetR/AcrR family transcriptional repressor of nem operon
MTETGLTHGCLYSQFANREVLVAEACRHALDKSVNRWRQRTTDPDIPDARAAIVERYLSASHRDHPGDGCLLSSLVTEIAKQSDPVQRRYQFKLALGSTVHAITDGRGSSISSSRRRAAVVGRNPAVGHSKVRARKDSPSVVEKICRQTRHEQMRPMSRN